jgi:hypothetical protein
MPVIPALGRLTQEDPKLQTSLGYLSENFSQKPKQNKNVTSEKNWIMICRDSLTRFVVFCESIIISK